jgi:hypothetical protein
MARMNRIFTVVLVLFALAGVLSIDGCGSGDSGSGSSNIWLLDAGGNALASLSVTASQGSLVPNSRVFVGYSSAVVGIIAGYPVGAPDPRTYGMDVNAVGSFPDNPVEFQVSFDTSLTAGAYQGTFRFVAVDNSYNVLGYADLPVTFTVN